MRVLIITANPKKTGALATLTREVTRGLEAGGAETEEIRLADCDIGFCKFCFRCIKDADSEIGPCSQDDDMTWILKKAKEADGFVMASQLSSAQVSARFKNFFERATYTAGRSTSVLFIKGIPSSRFTDKNRYAVTLVTAGGIPSQLRIMCNVATRQMVELSKRAFNAKVVGRLFAGMVRNGLKERDRAKAYELGRALASAIAENRT